MNYAVIDHRVHFEGGMHCIIVYVAVEMLTVHGTYTLVAGRGSGAEKECLSGQV